jgi:hypothetical protein
VYHKDNEFYILFVANRFNNENFWNGKWRSQWVLRDRESLEGTLKAQVHYFEGNLASEQTSERREALWAGSNEKIRTSEKLWAFKAKAFAFNIYKITLRYVQVKLTPTPHEKTEMCNWTVISKSLSK